MTTYDRDRCAKLVREMREDDERMSSMGQESEWVSDRDAVVVKRHPRAEFRCNPTNAISIARARNRLRETADQLEAAGTHIAELETRQQELLQTIVRLTNETSYPDEIKGWTEQRAKLVAEVGSLRSEVAERDRRIAELESETEQMRTLVSALRFNTDERARQAARIYELEAEEKQFRALCLHQAEQIADLRAAISVADRPRAIPPRHRWHAEPPTPAEVSERQWWWNKSPDGSTHVLQLDRDPGSGKVFDVGEVLNGACPPPFDPSDWPGEWAPCMTPDEVVARVSRIAEAGKRLVMSHVGKVRKLEAELATLHAEKRMTGIVVADANAAKLLLDGLTGLRSSGVLEAARRAEPLIACIPDREVVQEPSKRGAEIQGQPLPVPPPPALKLPDRKEWDAERYDSGDTSEADGYESSDYVDGWNEALDEVSALNSAGQLADPVTLTFERAALDDRLQDLEEFGIHRGRDALVQRVAIARDHAHPHSAGEAAALLVGQPSPYKEPT